MILLVLTLTLAGKNNAYAASNGSKCAKNVTLYYYNYKSEFGEGSYLHHREIYIGGLKSNALVYGVTCSSSKVKAYAAGGEIYLDVAGESSGGRTKYSVLTSKDKAVIRFKVKQKGKTCTLKTTVSFKPMLNPVSSIKVGNTTIKSFSLKNGTFNFTVKKPNASRVKVKVNLKPGYRYVKLYATYFKEGYQIGDLVKISNGGYVPLKNKEGTPLSDISVFCYTEADKQGIVTNSFMKKNSPSYAYGFIFK